MALITITGDNGMLLQASNMCPDHAIVCNQGDTVMCVTTGTCINDTANGSSGYVSAEETPLHAAYDSCEIMKHFNWDLSVDENGERSSLSSTAGLSMEAEADAALQRYPAVFRWTGTGQDVSLSGSFNNWRTKIPLVKSHGEFYTVVDVGEGTHQYKYFVDGQWICHPNEPKVDNGMGSQNNVITIRHEDCDIYRVLASDSLGTAAADPTATPPGSYSQYVPSRDAGFGFHRLGPPLLPPHLLETVLNKDVSAHCEPTMIPEPNHVVLNHLFTLSIKGGVMVLGTTHRYRKKYITTLLYKPI